MMVVFLHYLHTVFFFNSNHNCISFITADSVFYKYLCLLYYISVQFFFHTQLQINYSK